MSFKVNLNDLISWCRRQIYHFVFISALFALTLLVTWWAIFLYQSVDETFNTKLEGVRQSVTSYSMFLGHNATVKPEPGPYTPDSRLEIIQRAESPVEYASHLLPYWPKFWLQPKPEFVRSMENKRNRRRFMVLGESGFLLLLILVSGLMIYRMYLLEKRTTRELHEFWSRASHEIKTPITGIKAFLETINTQKIPADQLKPMIKLALKMVNRQQQLAENILVGQKLKQRASGVKLSSFELAAFLHSYLEKHPFYQQEDKLIAKIDEQQWHKSTVFADPEALRIILDNLIENARKYGGSKVEIKIAMVKQKKTIQLTVVDNGPGFEPKMAENIFGAYKRLGSELPQNQQKGTGMGLYICRQLARKMGGNLTAFSKGKDQGAGFTLSLKRK